MKPFLSWFRRNLRKDIVKIKHIIRQCDLYEWLLILYLVLYNIYFNIASIRRYDVFHAGRYDLGNMAQTVWNTTQGRIFQFTEPSGTETISRLAYHADFILVLLAPFYMIWESPSVLLVIQTFVLSLGAVFVFLIARNVTNNRLLSLVFAISYLLNPSIQRVNLYDFHAVAFATTFLLAAFYFIQKENYKYFLIFAILAGLTKEQVWVIISLMCLYIALRKVWRLYREGKKINLKLLNKKTIRFGLILSAISFIVFYILVAEIIPMFAMGEHFALGYFSELGSTPMEIIINTVINPFKVMSLVFGGSRTDYLIQIFSPLGFLSLVGFPYMIFAAPDLLINLVSKNDNLHQIYYQYTSTVTPFIYISAIYAVRVINKRIPSLNYTYIAIFLSITTLYTAYLYGPLWFSKTKNIAMFKEDPNYYSDFKKVIDSIPPDGLVSSSNSVGAHFSNREQITTLPTAYNTADYVFFNIKDTTASPSISYHEQLRENLKNYSNYEIIYDNGQLTAFKKIK